VALLAEIELEKDELLEQREVCRGRTQHVATAHTLQLLYIQLSGHVLCTNLPFYLLDVLLRFKTFFDAAANSLSSFRQLLKRFLFKQSYQPDMVYWHHPASGPCSGCIITQATLKIYRLID